MKKIRVEVGQKVTVVFKDRVWPDLASGGSPFRKFLRCYVTRRVANGWQLYDPVADWSWGLEEEQAGQRTIMVW